MLENQAMIDKLLGGRYRIVATLGSGGFSQTYVAEDTHRPGNPKCAVKHLQPANSNKSFLESARRLFNSEAETLEKLGHHDRIPRLLAYFEENQEFYLVQEFVEGQLLTDKLQPSQCWTENQAWEFIREILEILVFIHAQGFIHRDVKPSNIIQRQKDNKLVLVDFGAVKQNWTQLLSLTSNIEMPATIGIGTPGYMPMEQARGRPRPSSDIYALGAIATQALTGLYPMQLEEDFETGELLWREKAQVSDKFAAIITKMVRYHFKDRYESAADALAEIQQLAPLYLPTEIGLEIVPSLPQNSLPENLNTAITTPAFFSSAKPKATFNSSAIPGTTIVSPLRQSRSLFANRRPYYLTVGATIGAALISLGASYAIYWQPRLQFEQTLSQLEKLRDTGKYSECMTRAATIPQNSSLYADAQNVVNECKLTEAKRLATKANFKEAISLAASLPIGTSAYEQAKPLISQWYNSILALADSNYKAGKLKEAIALAQEIPANSPVYQKAQALIKQWQTPIAKDNAYTAATVNLTATKTKPTTAPAKKVVRSNPINYQPKTTASQPKRYPKPTKKVVRRTPTYRSKTTASQPKRYPASPKKVVRRTPTYRSKTTASQPRRYSKPTRRLQTSTASKRPILRTSSSRKYLRISKKAATSSQLKSRTKKVVRRITTRATRSSSRRQQSYRWTTKTVR